MCAVIARPALRRDRVIPAGQFPRGRSALPRRTGGLAGPVVPAAGGAQRAPRGPRRPRRGPAPGRRVVVTARVRRGGRPVVVLGTPGCVLAYVFWVVPAVAGHPPAPGADATSSPAGSPVERSASSAPCRMTAAAALSTCVRRCHDPRPRWRSASCAITVVNRSSTSRTGNGASRVARDSANALAVAAAVPARPDRPVGNPTMTSMAPCSVARAARASRSPRPRATVASGLASRPSGSHRATPTRADPRSMASRTPFLTHLACVLRTAPALRGGCSTVSSYATMSGYVCHNRPYHAKCLVKRGGSAVTERRAATLSHVVAATTAPTQRRSGLLDQRAGRQPALSGTVVDRDHDGRAVGGNTGHHDDRGPVAEPSAHVKGERADPVGAGPVGHPVRDEGHPVDVLRTGGQVAAAAEQLGRAQPLQFPLGVADPGHQGGEPLGELVAARLELFGQLAHQQALGRQVAERVGADQRLDPADPGPDGGLPEDLHQP